MIDASAIPALPRTHGRRLRQCYRSAGWPCLDTIEIDLLNAGLLERLRDHNGEERIRVTETGLRALGVGLQQNRKAFDAHETLVQRMAHNLASAGRMVYRGLMLRGRVDPGWQMCRPDVYSIRNTTLAAYASPVIHEIKVRRADLLSDLKNPNKRAAYCALSSSFFYVMPEGMADVDEIPEDCGVLYAGPSGFRIGRNSPLRAVELSIAEWMALARRGAEFLEPETQQPLLSAAER